MNQCFDLVSEISLGSLAYPEKERMTPPLLTILKSQNPLLDFLDDFENITFSTRIRGMQYVFTHTLFPPKNVLIDKRMPMNGYAPRVIDRGDDGYEIIVTAMSYKRAASRVNGIFKKYLKERN
jgi:hypothetical protein